MLSSRWRKILRDLWRNKARTFLAILAISVGIFGAGSILTTYGILTRELNADYLATNPASATLIADSVSAGLLQTARAFPGIAGAEIRRSWRGRIRVGPGEWRPLLLFALDDYRANNIGGIDPERGAWPPTDGAVLIERQALGVAKAKIGDSAIIMTPDGRRRILPIAGSVHDAGQPQAWMENVVYGYLTPATLASLGGPITNELRIVVAENPFDVAHIRKVANRLRDRLVKSGLGMGPIEVPRPGKHPHADVMASLLLVQQAFGLLALSLSGVLLINMFSALLAQQIRQIGVMKAIGAKTGQIMGIYFTAVVLLGLIATALALPASIPAGRAYAAFLANLLNFDLINKTVPLWVYAIQLILGVLVPMLVAAYPIYRGSRVTVKEAVSDYGVGQAQPSGQSREPLLNKFTFLERPFLLSLRNTFRRRGRLWRTLATLAAGGAIFITTLNVRASMLGTTDKMTATMRFDLNMTFSRPYPVSRITGVLRGVPGVAAVECWGDVQAAILRPNGGEESNRFNMYAPPIPTGMLDLPLENGRWLKPGDAKVLVVNKRFLQENPEAHMGDVLALKIGGKRSLWKLEGVVKTISGVPVAYTDYNSLAGAAGTPGYAEEARVVGTDHDPAAIKKLKASLEPVLTAAGLDVLNNESNADRDKTIQDHLKILTIFLMLMTAVFVTVGGLSLTSTMSLNVLERRREIGVMRAIGASNHTVLSLIISEGLLIGLISWLLAIALALPLSLLIDAGLGQMMFRLNLILSYPALGVISWLAVTFFFSIVATVYPAWTAARLTVREAVAYE